MVRRGLAVRIVAGATNLHPPTPSFMMGEGVAEYARTKARQSDTTKDIRLGGQPMDDLILDGTKIAWYPERVAAWERGDHIAPITIDMALLPRPLCNMNCQFCYADHQSNGDYNKRTITWEVIRYFLDDAAEIGVKGISFVSDGESSHSPAFVPAIHHGHDLGLAMAVGSNSLTITKKVAEQILPCLTYLRVNISAGERERYAAIMGAKPQWFDRVCTNIADMVEIKRRDKLSVTIGLQMVLMPDMADQVIPLAQLAINLGADYAVIKHCSDTETKDIGVEYDKYEEIYPLLRQAEAMSTDDTKIMVKWSKIKEKGTRSYSRCYGPPFILQISGSGLVAPCGMLFNEKFKEGFHIGSIVTQRFKDIWNSDRYRSVMAHLASPKFNAKKQCGSLCLQHCTNEVLDKHVKGTVPFEPKDTPLPAHGAFV